MPRADRLNARDAATCQFTSRRANSKLTPDRIAIAVNELMYKNPKATGGRFPALALIRGRTLNRRIGNERHASFPPGGYRIAKEDGLRSSLKS